MNKKEAWSLPYGIIHFLKEHQGYSDNAFHKELLNFKADFKRLPKSKAKFLYRGIELDNSKLQKLLKGETLKSIKTMESWTTDVGVAQDFGRFVFKKAIPLKEQVADLFQLGNAIDELDIAHEREVVCFGQDLRLKDLVLDDDCADMFDDLISDKLHVEFPFSQGSGSPSFHVDKVALKGNAVELKVNVRRVLNYNSGQSKDTQLTVTLNEGKIENIAEHKKTIKEKLSSQIETKNATVSQETVLKYLKKLSPDKRRALLKKVV